MPAVQLDLYLISADPIQWRTEDLRRVIDRRLDRGRPVIIDGVLALDALAQIDREPDFLVFVKGGHSESRLAPQIAAYQARKKPQTRANFTMDGYTDPL
jgi:hypothetical protein